jgi:glyoxylase-like metal-dependent hydrolase (beta-lactamase superfamily II)
MRQRKAWLGGSILALVLVTIAFAVPLGSVAYTEAAQGLAGRGDSQAIEGIEMVPVKGGVHMIAGAGANIAVLVGATGLVVVDTGNGSMNDRVVAAIRRASALPIRYIINTSANLEHTGGNEAIDKIGKAYPNRELNDEGANIIAHENVLLRMSAPPAGVAPRPVAALPTTTFFTDEKDLYMGGQAIRLTRQPAAHSDGDLLVYFRGSDVVVAGEVFDKTRYPMIDASAGGSINGIVDALNRLLDVMVADQYEEGGTLVVPNHGRVSDESDVVEYRDMMTIVRDRVAELVKRGRTLEQVKAARPTMEYDPVYGSTSGAADMLVESIYRGLTAGGTR